MKGLKYEMEAFRALRKAEIENELLEFEAELEKEYKKRI